MNLRSREASDLQSDAIDRSAISPYEFGPYESRTRHLLRAIPQCCGTSQMSISQIIHITIFSLHVMIFLALIQYFVQPLYFHTSNIKSALTHFTVSS